MTKAQSPIKDAAPVCAHVSMFNIIAQIGQRDGVRALAFLYGVCLRTLSRSSAPGQTNRRVEPVRSKLAIEYWNPGEILARSGNHVTNAATGLSSSILLSSCSTKTTPSNFLSLVSAAMVSGGRSTLASMTS
jgi:hypothetical protein